MYASKHAFTHTQTHTYIYTHEGKREERREIYILKINYEKYLYKSAIFEKVNQCKVCTQLRNQTMKPGTVAHTLITALGRKKHKDLCGLKASQVYIVSTNTTSAVEKDAI